MFKTVLPIVRRFLKFRQTLTFVSMWSKIDEQVKTPVSIVKNSLYEIGWAKIFVLG